MIPIIMADGAAEYAKIASMRARAAAVGAEVERTALDIMSTVKAHGYSAVEAYSQRLDGAPPREIGRDELDAAVGACSPQLIAALTKAAENIRAYQQNMLPKAGEWASPDGGTVGRLVRGLDRVGVYVPGGTAAYPSSVLMTVVPARVAGVRDIVMVTPPTRHLNQAVLAAAKIAGVDRVIAVGGAQAVAALTYGADWIPRVDKLVGPGNAYVAAAKRLAFGTLDIDMIAGPSEVLIIADEGANPQYIAADLLSQAEHDALASAVLLTDSSALAGAVAQQVAAQLSALERRDIAAASLRDYGCVIVCGTLRQAATLSNELAPEHLEIMTENPRALLPHIENAGAVFLGPWSPEPLGDYMAGPSHVLPTGGTARFFSPLSAADFVKTISVMEYDRAALGQVAGQIMTLAQAEGLSAHANAVRIRM